jgi:hypothetical protein
MRLPEGGAPSEVVISQCVLQQVVTHVGKSGTWLVVTVVTTAKKSARHQSYAVD